MRYKISALPIAILVLASALSFSQVDSHRPELRFPIENFTKDDAYRVVKIVDGDTIKIDYKGRTESVRLIGVNTPETVHPNKPAAVMLCRSLDTIRR